MLIVNPGAIVGLIRAIERATSTAQERTLVRQLLPQARDPNTAADGLDAIFQTATEHLHELPRRDVRRIWQPLLDAIAENPSCPPPTLAAIVYFSPRAFCRNPVVPLLFLADGDWLRRADLKELGPLLRLREVPQAVVSGLVAYHRRQEVRMAAQLHVAFDGDAKDGWETEMRAYWRQQTNTSGGLERESRIELGELGLAPAWIAGPAPWSPPRAARLAAYPSVRLPHGSEPLQEQLRAARDPMTSATDLRRLARSRNESVRIAVLQHSAACAVALRLACRPNWAQGNREQRIAMPDRYAAHVVQHANADAFLLRRIAANSGHPTIRRLARIHPNAPPNTTILCRRACIRTHRRTTGHVDPTVLFSRFAIRTRPEIGWRAARRAADSDLWQDRLAAALNPGLDWFALRRLARDANVWVRAAAQKRLRGETVRWDA